MGHFAKFIRINGAFNWEKGRFQILHILLHLSKNGIYKETCQKAQRMKAVRDICTHRKILDHKQGRFR